MPTPDEIQRRIEENDTARSAKRAAVAKRVGELAQHRAATAEQLADIERELGDVLVDAQDVIGVDELAKFTDIAATDLTQWLTARTTRKTTRSKPKRRSSGPSSTNSGAPSQTPTPGPATTSSDRTVPRTSGRDRRAPAEVT